MATGGDRYTRDEFTVYGNAGDEEMHRIVLNKCRLSTARDPTHAPSDNYLRSALYDRWKHAEVPFDA